MEKIFWVCSNNYDRKDGLEDVNKHLADGWTVKMMVGGPCADAFDYGQAYIVLEKKDQ